MNDATVIGAMVVIGVVVIGAAMSRAGAKAGRATGSSPGGSGGESPVKALATHLGLQYRAVPRPEGPEWKNLYQWDSHRAEGTYAGVPVEVIFESWSKPAPGGFEYSANNQVRFRMAKPGAFRIEPKQPNQGSTPTGNAAFDARFMFAGDPGMLTPPQLEAIASLGWINLRAKDGELIFQDDYFQSLRAQAGGAMAASAALMTAVHPIWGQSASQPNIDLPRAAWFFDLLAGIARA